MEFIADLHIHSRHSRATSTSLTLANLEKYARIKGLNVLGTGDFTHPEWIKEIKSDLTEQGNGILKSSTGFDFILQTELSLIYTQDNKGRRVHNIVLAPDLGTVEQITEYLKKHGRVDYDGRPIFKIPCDNFVYDLRKINEKIEVIPAHCLLPGTLVHANPQLKSIDLIKKNDNVLTHNGRFRKVLTTYKRFYKGNIYAVVPWYFTRGLTTTEEHPFYAIKSYKMCSWIKGTCKPLCSQKNNCKRKLYKDYSPEWVQAKKLEKGDFIIYPRVKEIADKDKIKVSDIVKDIHTIRKDSRTKHIKEYINIDKEFCRLVGYYVAEGYTISNEAIGFSFNKKEKEFIKDVISLMKHVFGIDAPSFDKRKGVDIIYYSHVLNNFFRSLFYSGDEKRAWNKSIPEFMLFLNKEKQAELLRGWWRGDAGYTVSHNLANQMKIICIRLGIIPSISEDSAENFKKRGKHFIGKREIITNRDTFVFSNLSFFESKELLDDKCFKKFINRRNMKHGWVDMDNIYLPIRKIDTKYYEGDVYNLEVEEDNSYVTEFATVHNCWTPWFSLFGSMSGFDSVEEGFKDQAKHIHALETGLSSDPAMNWRISSLDKYSLVSFSDLHSFWPWRIGREATIFDLKELSYSAVINALKTKEGLKETIEFFPEEGKYHFDGHRACDICLNPADSMKLNDLCPKCGRALTIGVAHRVEQLADRPYGFRPKGAAPFKSLISLSDIIAGTLKTAVASKKVWAEYNKLIAKFNNELNITLNVSEEELVKVTSPAIAKLVIKNRSQQIKFNPGYDGVYGEPIFDEDEEKEFIKKEKETKHIVASTKPKPRQAQTSLTNFS